MDLLSSGLDGNGPLSAFPLPRRDTARACFVRQCAPGAVLRALLLVESGLALAALFEATHGLDWLERFAVLSAGGLGATLLWLLGNACLQTALRHRAGYGPTAAGIGWGLVCGWYGCAAVPGSELLALPSWLASAAAGGWAAALLLGGQRLRAGAVAGADSAARLAGLQARIRPHFLFNTLNSAMALLRQDPARAERVLEDLSDLFRQALRDPDGAVTLGEELALARNYLEIEQLRFGARLRVRWALDPTADGARLPTLLLQPLLENAVRHGVEPSAEGADLYVRTRRRGASVRVDIANTVPCAPDRPGQGLALANVRERLALLHDVEGGMRWGMRAGVFRVRLELPL